MTVLDVGRRADFGRPAMSRPRAILMVDDRLPKELSVPSSVSQNVTARSQAVDARLTRAAIFLVVTIGAGEEPKATVRGLCAILSSLVRGVGFRAADGGLSCIMGIGSDAWDHLFGAPRPKELHPFREIRGVHHAPSTLRANDDETNAALEFTLEGRGHRLPWSCDVEWPRPREAVTG